MPPAANPITQFLPFVFIFLIFYFLVIKPEKNKQKQHKEMLQNIKKNDQIVTTGGLHGKVVAVKEKTIMVRVDDNVKLEFDKEAVATLTSSKNPAK